MREERKPAAPDNSLAKLEAEVSQQLEAALDGYRDLRDRWSLNAAVEAAEADLIRPVLVGSEARIRAVAEQCRLDIRPSRSSICA